MNDREVYDARLEILDFLIEVYHDAPDEGFVERLLSGDVQIPDGGVTETMDQGFDRLQRFIDRHENRSPATVSEELQIHYTSLFVGPRPPIHPHETYYREDTEFIGEGLAEVEAAYAAAGWSPPENYPEENDHVAIELAFLRHLVARQREGDEETFGFEQVFLDEHVRSWYEQFLEDLRSELDDDPDLFLAAGEVFAGFIEFETELVRQQTSA